MATDRKIDYVILGLLSHEDLSGYEIKARIDGAIRFFFKGSFGSIFPALNDMEEKGLIAKKETTSKGRKKTTYKITDAGLEKLKAWLESEQALNELKYETLLKLFFGGCEPINVSLKNIEAFEAKIKSDLLILKGYRDALKEAPESNDHLCFSLTVSFGIETYEAYLRWCKKAKKMLSMRKENGD